MDILLWQTNEMGLNPLKFTNSILPHSKRNVALTNALHIFSFYDFQWLSHGKLWGSILILKWKKLGETYWFYPRAPSMHGLNQHDCLSNLRTSSFLRSTFIFTSAPTKGFEPKPTH